MYSVSSYSFDVPTPGCNYCKAVYIILLVLFCYLECGLDNIQY